MNKLIFVLVSILTACGTANAVSSSEKTWAPIIEFGTQHFDWELEREVVGQSCVQPYRGTEEGAAEYADYTDCCPPGWRVLGLSPNAGVLCQPED